MDITYSGGRWVGGQKDSLGNYIAGSLGATFVGALQYHFAAGGNASDWQGFTTVLPSVTPMGPFVSNESGTCTGTQAGGTLVDTTKNWVTNCFAGQSVHKTTRGTATGTQTATTLQDTTQNWPVNLFQGAPVYIDMGPGQGRNVGLVLSNTATTLTINMGNDPQGNPLSLWPITVVSGQSHYVLASEQQQITGNTATALQVVAWAYLPIAGTTTYAVVGRSYGLVVSFLTTGGSGSSCRLTVTDGNNNVYRNVTPYAPAPPQAGGPPDWMVATLAFAPQGSSGTYGKIDIEFQRGSTAAMDFFIDCLA